MNISDEFGLSIYEALQEIPQSEPEIIRNGGGFDGNESNDNPGDSSCPVCGADDWEVDVSRGIIVCRCGFCEVGVTLAQVSQRERPNDNGVLGRGFCEDARYISAVEMGLGGGRSSGRKKYKHQTYYAERIKYWAMQEPAIPAHEWDIILASYRKWARNRFGFVPVIPTAGELATTSGCVEGAHICTKDDVYAILSGAAAEETLDASEKSFTRRFFKQWLTIRFRLSGVKSTYSQCPPWLLEKMEELFGMVVAYFNRFVQKKTFPLYNYVIARLLDLFGREDLAVDFPSSKNKKQRWALNNFWRGLCTFYSWPYINSTDGR